ncbi:MAG: hypothetical protein JO021_17110 [Alphaproteobacteria bacterium]|nr:hypothetical protein [Alphaproteobacteria bacterium]
MIDSETSARPTVATGSEATAAGLPVPVPQPRHPPHRRAIRPLIVVALIALVGSAGGYAWWQHTHNGLPAGIAFGNGRIESDEIDIQTKFAGRIAERFVDEGDLVHPGASHLTEVKTLNPVTALAWR